MNLSNFETKKAIIGMVIGDGCLSKFTGRKGTKVGNAYYQMTHCKAQYEYLLWKKDILEKVAKCTIWENNHKAPNGKECEGYRLRSQSNPTYTRLHSRFYPINGKKSVDEYLVKMIDPLALAIIFMDDGCISKPMPKYYTKETFTLSLCNFDYANLFLIKKSLKLQFDLEWNINKTSRKYYHLRLLNSNNQKFVDIIYPYVSQVPSMMYKLGSYVRTSSTEDGDMI